ncbi:unnamed protein product [Danaus chrysippus]|uniref:gamma-glutamylcyclotransferase n=1 Tax=Danaus chrysippus TaxID=151541 RepID=A0A8J2R2A0_9NEOP|nr:unnamed protein product [Danaus chrysippus]
MESFKTAVYIHILFSFSIFKLVLTEDGVEPISENKFLYFAYGSNLLAKRIHINNPTAEFFSAAKLPNFRLDFQSFDTEYWNGADATIVDDGDSVVWGALWTLDVKDIPHLDEQEGIHLGEYRTRNVSVVTPDGRIMMARTYQMTLEPPKLPPKDIPPERQPSDTYMECPVSLAPCPVSRAPYLSPMLTRLRPISSVASLIGRSRCEGGFFNRLCKYFHSVPATKPGSHSN